MSVSINDPTIKRILSNAKFVPLYVEYNGEFRQAKLYEDESIQTRMIELLKEFDSLRDANHSIYALKLKSKNVYINEKNRCALLAIDEKTKFHEVLVCFNMETEVRVRIEKLSNTRTSQVDTILGCLKTLEENVTADINFAYAFLGNKGKTKLIDCIKEWKDSNDPKQWELLCQYFRNFTLLIQKCEINWDSNEIDLLVIEIMCDKLNNLVKENRQSDTYDSIVLLFLQIIADIIINPDCKSTRDFILKNLKYSEIIFHIRRHDVSIKSVLLKVINQSFNHGDPQLKYKINEIMNHQSVKTLLEEVKNGLELKRHNEIVKNLALLQKLTLSVKFHNLVKEIQKSDFMDIIEEICENAFHVSSSSKTYLLSDKCAKLGFVTPHDPCSDFDCTSLSLLTLKFMRYFSDSEKYKSILQTFVIERMSKSNEYIFPFAKASNNLIKLLCEMMRIGDETEPEPCYELIFATYGQHSDGLNEFISICLCLFNKLWNEMKAQMLDFTRALMAFKDAFTRILAEINGRELEFNLAIKEFTSSMETFKYDNLKQSRKEKIDLKPITELQEIITNEVIELIRPKRMNVLCKGQFFEMKILTKEKDKKEKHKQCLWKLSCDLREFLYNDVDTSDSDTVVRSGTVLLDFIRDVKKERIQNMSHVNITYKNIYEKDAEEVHFLLSNQSDEIIDTWLDGINLLLKPESNANIKCFVECLVDTQLLDLKTLGISIPADIPQVPALPLDFNFATH